MNNQLKDKIAKIMALINQGATDGEKQAAKKALERIIKAHNIDESQLTSVMFKEYQFKFTTTLEKQLLTRIALFFHPESLRSAIQRHYKRVTLHLTYDEWVTIECAYEFFRRHMKSEYRKAVVPIIKNHRTRITKQRAKQDLEPIFFSNYIIASKLCKPEEMQPLNFDEMSEAELKKRMKLAGVEGGSYKKQVDDTKYLTN